MSVIIYYREGKINPLKKKTISPMGRRKKIMRDKIIFKNAMGESVIGYAILANKNNPTETDYVWCFDKKNAQYGYTIATKNIIKVF